MLGHMMEMDTSITMIKYINHCMKLIHHKLKKKKKRENQPTK